MPPIIIITLRPEMIPCNGSNIIIEYNANMTSLKEEDKGEEYDHIGAMEFIIATLLVYSLIGIVGLLLLRIRRRASKYHRNASGREEHLQTYIKQSSALQMAGHRDVLKMAAARATYHIQMLELHKSKKRNNSENGSGNANSNDESPFLLQSDTTDGPIRLSITPPQMTRAGTTPLRNFTARLPSFPEEDEDDVLPLDTPTSNMSSIGLNLSTDLDESISKKTPAAVQDTRI